MIIRYTEHLKRRLKFRRIPDRLPRVIVRKPSERYIDIATYHDVAIKRARYAKKLRWMVVVYDKIDRNLIEVVTIHPIDRTLIERRIVSGRWIKQ